jgi:hypothetical protein
MCSSAPNGPSKVRPSVVQVCQNADCWHPSTSLASLSPVPFHLYTFLPSCRDWAGASVCPGERLGCFSLQCSAARPFIRPPLTRTVGGPPLRDSEYLRRVGAAAKKAKTAKQRTSKRKHSATASDAAAAAPADGSDDDSSSAASSDEVDALSAVAEFIDQLQNHAPPKILVSYCFCDWRPGTR